MKTSAASQRQSASDLISAKIAALGDWRGDTLGRMRRLIKDADPDVVEEWKWRGTPTWSHDGIICTGNAVVIRKNVPRVDVTLRSSGFPRRGRHRRHGDRGLRANASR